MLCFILIIVLIVLFIQYLHQFKGFNEGFKESMKPRDSPTKKGLLCYYGGAFRYGHSGNSNQDTEKGFDSQYYSTQSHIKLAEIIKSQGYDVDTIINTYHSAYEKNLSTWYNPYEILPTHSVGRAVNSFPPGYTSAARARMTTIIETSNSVIPPLHIKESSAPL
jgi:hypothetical protein